MKTYNGLADRMIRSALDMGAAEAEAFVLSSRNLLVEVKKDDIESLESSIDHGYCIRVIKDGREGFSFSTDPRGIEECVNKAIAVSQWSDEDEHLGLPSDEKHSDVDTFDNKIEGLDEDAVTEMALSVERAATGLDRRITKTRKTSVSTSYGDIIIKNSKGLEKRSSFSSISSHIMVVAEDRKDSQTGWDYQGCRYLADMDFERIGRTAAKRALQLLGAEKCSPAKAMVILDSATSVEFLSILASTLTAESVQKGKSLLEGRLGDRIASERIDIVDDGLIDRYMGSRPFDAEGVPTRSKVPIEKGVLKGYLHNTYTAKKDGVSSTGNAVRSGFKSIPSVGITNLFIRPSAGSSELPLTELISSVDDGIFITEAMGIHTANPISGDFSVGVTGIWIKGGKFSNPVKEAVMSGNILDLYRNVEACSDDLRFYGKIGSPSLLIRDLDISG